MSQRTSTLAVTLLLATAAGSLAISPAAHADFPAPVAAGESAANIDLSSADRRVLVRWVARSTGTLAGLHLRIQADGAACRNSGRTGYGLGNGGSWHVTTYSVLADGRPDQATTLATQDFRPCDAPTAVADVRQGVVRLAMGLDVAKGTEYATVISNADAAPAQNYTSMNFLYTTSGILGANGRNERSPLAADAYYGLDPRELIGFSRDGGRTWALPGGPYGMGTWAENPNFLPTYLQEYSDGQITGQPYYYAAAPSSTDRTMVFGNIRHSWTIRELGAYTPKAGAGTLTLTVDGNEAASVPVSGTGMLRAAIAPVTVSAGQVVRVTASGLTIQDIVADTAWGRLTGLHLASTPWKVEGEPNFSHAAPVYALPAYGTPEPDPPAVTPPAEVPPAVTPPPMDPPAVTPPPVDPPLVTLPPVDPPVFNPPVVTPPPVDPPVVNPPVVTPPPVNLPVVNPPVVTPPAVIPPVLSRPPVVTPPVVAPRPKPPKSGRGGGTSTACGTPAHRRPRARAKKSSHRRAYVHRGNIASCRSSAHRRARSFAASAMR